MNGALPVRLLQLTDPHLFEDESQELYGVNTAASFHAALARGLAAARGPLDAVLITGDIAEDGRRRTYERFRSIVGQVGVRVICIPGNHENPPMMSALFSEPPLQYCGSISIRGWRIVPLGSHAPGEDPAFKAPRTSRCASGRSTRSSTSLRPMSTRRPYCTPGDRLSRSCGRSGSGPGAAGSWR